MSRRREINPALADLIHLLADIAVEEAVAEAKHQVEDEQAPEKPEDDKIGNKQSITEAQR